MVARTGHLFGRAFAVVVTSVLVALFAALPAGMAAAQDASPVATPETDALAAAGLPEIIITAKDTTFSPSVPGAMVEGWYLITLTNETDVLASANIGMLPEGQTVGDLTSALGTAFKGAGGELPEWWSSATFAGGNVAAGGATTHTLAYLTPGKWVIFSTNPAAVQSPSVFTILTPEEAEANYGIAPAATPVATPGASPVAGAQAPEGVTATASIDLADTAIQPAGDVPAAGPVIVEVTNSGEQVHELVLVKTDQPVDQAGAATLATSYANGEALTGATVVGGIGTLGGGQTAYMSATLEPGSYVLFSSLPDANGGLQSDAGLVLAFDVQ
jgi:hypothetical protein